METRLAERDAAEASPPGAPTGSVAMAVAHAWRLLARSPDLAAAQAREILHSVPGHGEARLILQIARAQEIARLDPGRPGVWRSLGDLLTQAGDRAGADAAYVRHVETAVNDAELMQAGDALSRNQLDVAEALLRTRLRAHPTDVAALRMLAELGGRLGRYHEAEAMLSHCLELSPSFVAARRTLAGALHRQNKGQDALAEVERLLEAEPNNPTHRSLNAAVSASVGDYERSIAAYRDLLAEHPDQPKMWVSLGHVLKTLGRQDESVEAYRRCIALAPNLGEAWWSLANLKTFRFDAEQIAAMQAALELPKLDDEDRLHLEYALGKALEDQARFDESFGHYAAGATIQKARLGYDAESTTRQARQVAQVFSAELFAAKVGLGDPSPDPIFILGLPRSGSTLIEQILSSHPHVEGTMELPEIAAIARLVGDAEGVGGYPDGVSALDAKALAALGQRFLERTRIHRKSGRPFFIDKMPNNWLHTGLIRLILPNAKIIDARRHPLATCFSAFKQHFARGQNFSYDLTDLGLYYRDYVELMAHFDRALPGAVHRVIYEDMVEHTEREVRRLLNYCGLPFDPACLRFYETERAVRTASSEQVRRPIFREGLEQWRNYEAHLEPLRAALGPVLESYPNAAE
jgi:tetratricopeptide (TPR) repeat protein